MDNASTVEPHPKARSFAKLGFNIDPRTGYWAKSEDEDPDVDVPPDVLRPVRIVPIVRDRKNALLFRFREPERYAPETIATVQHALMRGLEVAYQLEQGEVLAEIEPVHYRDQVEQARGKLDLAEAELKRQEAGLAKLKKEVPLQIDLAEQTLEGARTEKARAEAALTLTTNEVHKTIDEAKAAVQLAKANLTLAKQEYDRWTTLAAQDATTKRKATRSLVPNRVVTPRRIATSHPAQMATADMVHAAPTTKVRAPFGILYYSAISTL